MRPILSSACIALTIIPGSIESAIPPGLSGTSVTGTFATGWRPVDLPFRPTDVSVTGDELWVCGADEMIAVSRDAGKTWQIKHQTVDGDVLLRIRFAGPLNGYAAGTNGAFFFSKDGGETWASVRDSAETVLDISFSDMTHGIRRSRSKVELTADGGLHWTEVSALRSDPVVQSYTNVISVASLDSVRAAIALHQTQGENIFAITRDGGRTWIPVHIDNTFAGDLKEIEAGVLAVVGDWFFEPARKDGQPVEFKQGIKMSVSCIAFPGNDFGNCNILGPRFPKR